jgi:hypothetical protein
LSFLNTLLCKQGCDNHLRFFIINLTSYISFLFINYASNNKVLSLIVLFISAYLVTLSTLRRLNDANLKTNWLILAVALYLLIGLAMVFISMNVINLLMLIPFSFSALLLTYPSNNKNRHNQKYLWGYNGPIDLSSYKDTQVYSQKSRIEPSFIFNENTINTTFESTGSNQNAQRTNKNNRQATQIKEKVLVSSKESNSDSWEIIRKKLLWHKKAILIIVSISLLAIFTLSKTTNSSGETQLNNNTNIVSQHDITLLFKRIEQLDMPDNFTLFFNQYGGLIINWQADKPSAKQTWSIITAQGDESCQQIHFNKGEAFRTLTVTVENKLNHYANFSPLDTQKLLQAIAFRGNFTLCDFKFSLKGSQAALNKNSKYAEQINY